VSYDYVKSIALLRRKDGMSRPDFENHWINKHAPLARLLPGLLSYSITFVDPEYVGEFGYDGVAELRFATLQARNESFASAESQAVIADLNNFAGKRIATLGYEYIQMSLEQSRANS
jgi:uncharacterized protein (TIGR02118 family)